MTTITPFCVADLLAEDGRMPVCVHVIDHPGGRVLVDTGMTELHPAVADLDPRWPPPGSWRTNPNHVRIGPLLAQRADLGLDVGGREGGPHCLSPGL